MSRRSASKANPLPTCPTYRPHIETHVNSFIAASSRIALASLLAASSLLAAMLLLTGCGQASANPHSCSARLQAAHAKGQFAFLSNGGVSIVALPSCTTHVLAAYSNARAPLRFSRDGLYLAYGDGQVLSASSPSTPTRPLGKLSSWTWAPSGHTLAGVTANGSVALSTPSGLAKEILPPHSHAYSVRFTPDGRTLLVAKELSTGRFASRVDQVVAISLSTRKQTVLAQLHRAAYFFGGIAGVTPNSRYVLLWPDTSGSSSIAADGLPLRAVPIGGGAQRTLVATMLPYPDYIAACRSRLIVTAGRSREADYHKTLLSLSPPSFQPQSLQLSSALSWTNASCSAHGDIAVAAGLSVRQPRFGLQHRAIWLVPAHRSPLQLTRPSRRHVSDELPRISRNGDDVLFVRMTTSKGAGRGQLELAAVEHRKSNVIGPIARLGDIGIGYYDHYGWAEVTAWHE
jgi:hypothetical protein